VDEPLELSRHRDTLRDPFDAGPTRAGAVASGLVLATVARLSDSVDGGFKNPAKAR
jgi:hypothetical protein